MRRYLGVVLLVVAVAYGARAIGAIDASGDRGEAIVTGAAIASVICLAIGLLLLFSTTGGKRSSGGREKG